jgi:hypothetical protein
MTAIWTPGIHDPTAQGWVTVTMYAVASVLCAVCAQRAHARSAERRVWLGAGAVMAVLGVNKQLDLQTWFTHEAREIATAQGWYEDRQRVQVLFVAVVGVLGLIGLTVLQNALRHFEMPLRVAVAGLAVTFAFIVIRSTSLHVLDQLQQLRVFGLPLNSAFELTGILGVASAATVRILRGSVSEA